MNAKIFFESDNLAKIELQDEQRAITMAKVLYFILVKFDRRRNRHLTIDIFIFLW